MVDRHITGDQKYIKDGREEHISGCTDMVVPEMFHLQTFPYIFTRNKFKVELIDIKNQTIHQLASELNTTNMYTKLVVV